MNHYSSLFKDVPLEPFLEEKEELTFQEIKNQFPEMLDHDIRRMCFVLVIQNKAEMLRGRLIKK